jgi:decaprenylphospho-beta-D-ribofuranose 2-oxidase
LTWRPDSADAARAVLRDDAGKGAIAYGCGRSYGDPCLNDGGTVLDMRALNEVYSFDDDTGDLDCGAGYTLDALMRRFVPLGFASPMCPGTAFVTLGGLIANDVHGKNHHRVGSMGDIVHSFDLVLPHGDSVTVARDTEPDLFAATLGGIGLTGIITRVRMRLRRIPSNAVDVEELPVRDLDGFIERLIESRTSHEHTVGWIDTLARGAAMGRGVLERANASTQPAKRGAPPRIPVPMQFPEWVLNRYTVAAFNEGYFRRIPRGGRRRVLGLSRFLFPLDSLLHWNRMYGPRGVYQFQCVLPYASAREGLVRLMESVTRSAAGSFLSVIKTMDATGAGMLSFPIPGFSLAMDFPRRAETGTLIRRLHDIVIAHGGRVYLAKDANLTPEQFRAMYPRVEELVCVRRRIDPEQRMRSDMARRLGLVTETST